MATAGEEEEGDGGDGGASRCGARGRGDTWGGDGEQGCPSQVPITLAPGLEERAARAGYGDKVPRGAAGTGQPPCWVPAAGTCQGLRHEEEEEEDKEEDKDEEDRDEEDKDEEDKDEDDKEKEEKEKER